jgi:transposase
MNQDDPEKKRPAKPKTPARGGKRGRKKVDTTRFELVHPDAAGIDLGNQSHWVAIPPDRAGETVREFGTTTGALHAMADWLAAHNVRTVAMEATGVLWVPVYELLERRGFEVYLVHAAHVKNAAGRKTDVLDCQWIQKLHACGLLRASFRPDDKTVVLRSYVRQHAEIVRQQSAYTQRMQKALAQMNIRLAIVVADITGVTGLSIIRHILDGERDPQVLAELRDRHCKHSVAEIAEALRGNWREEHLFALRQALATWEHLDRQLDEVNREIEKALTALSDDPRVDASQPLPPPTPKIRVAQKSLGFDARTLLHQKAGADITEITGVNLMTALTIVSEIGTDMSRWPTVGHFAAWLRLAPNPRISGGKELPSRPSGKNTNRAANAFRMAASTVNRSDGPLGTFYRRKAHKGKTLAVKATAHRLARWVYTILKHGTKYNEHAITRYQQREQQRHIASLRRAAAKYNLALVPAAPPPPSDPETGVR